MQTLICCKRLQNLIDSTRKVFFFAGQRLKGRMHINKLSIVIWFFLSQRLADVWVRVTLLPILVIAPSVRAVRPKVPVPEVPWQHRTVDSELQGAGDWNTHLTNWLDIFLIWKHCSPGFAEVHSTGLFLASNYFYIQTTRYIWCAHESKATLQLWRDTTVTFCWDMKKKNVLTARRTNDDNTVFYKCGHL